MSNISELRKMRETALAKADSIVASAEQARRPLTASESTDVDSQMAVVNFTNPQIATWEKNNSITRMIGAHGALLTDARPSGVEKLQPKTFSREYMADFIKYVQSNGREIGAALYESGGGPTGGYAVPSIVDDQIVPLAPQEMAVRRLASVIPTTSDIKFPVKASFGATTAKAETASFTESDMTLGTFTLSAFMAGNNETLSWELAQDVPAFQATTVDDLILGQQMYEENLYVNGTGTGQAQGLIGNVGAGVTEEPDSNGNLVSISGTLDLLGTLNAVYHANASFLMSRLTSIGIRKAQVQSNLFNPVWQRVGKQDFLHGYPVEYSASMPTAARSAAPVLFGDFKRGYLIGDRGGSGINVKVLDQPKALQGEIVLLAYRRTDGRVRRSEAIQQYNISAS